MFITFKNPPAADEASMKPIASHSANPTGTNSRLRSTRKAACLACQARKLWCSGGSVCDRCKVSGITCIFSQKPRQHHRRRNVDYSATVSSNDNTTAPAASNLDTTSPHLTDPGAQLYDGFSLSSAFEVGDVDPNRYSLGNGIQVNLNYEVDTPLPDFDAITASMMSPPVSSSPSSRPTPASEGSSPNQTVDSSITTLHRPHGDPIDSMSQATSSTLPSQISSTDAKSNGVISNSGQSPANDKPCDCINNMLSIVQRLDDDEFHLTTLPLDQVFHLKKWLIFQCCKPLDCTSCSTMLAGQSIVLVVCERLSEMFECISKRIRRAASVMITSEPSGRDHASTDSPPGFTTAHDDDDDADPLHRSAGHLFDGTTGGPSKDSICNPMMFSGQVYEQYSEEEQIHLIQVLLKFQIRSFRQLLGRVGDPSVYSNSVARSAKIAAMISRLDSASAAIDAALQAVLRSYDGGLKES
ncbi:hypothetical protein BX600DRAFT_451963 [Xylariales sp. PMI_506]|nr:hypothetical protein BX600DRAFT_451963 [Xylariales sp. PMI_506]